MRWIYNKKKQNNIYGTYYSLEKAFEICWSSFADKHNNFNKIDQEKRTTEQILLYLEPHDYLMYYG